MNHSTPGLPVHHQLLESTQTHVHWVGDAIQPPHPLSYPSSPASNPSQHQGLFQWVNSLQEVAKILEFQLQLRPSSEHPGLISSRMDGLDLLAVEGTLKSLLQHHSSKASILQIVWPKYWIFSFNISPSNEHPDWFPLGRLQTWTPIAKFRIGVNSSLSFGRINLWNHLALGFCLYENLSLQFWFPCLWLIYSCFLFLPGSILECYAFIGICTFL